MVEDLKKEVATKLHILSRQLENKLEASALDETHEKFSHQLDKTVASITKRFMDKQETRKTFKTFEKQLKNLFDIVVSKFEEEQLDDAMAAKKPLGGWSCISCQKNISNLSGSIAEF